MDIGREFGHLVELVNENNPARYGIRQESYRISVLSELAQQIELAAVIDGYSNYRGTMDRYLCQTHKYSLSTLVISSVVKVTEVIPIVFFQITLLKSYTWPLKASSIQNRIHGTRGYAWFSQL